jgi:phosphinothricin acetyltransferase
MGPALVVERLRRDLAGVARICNAEVTGSTVTFDEAPWTEDDARRWFASRSPGRPVVVAELEGRVVGRGEYRPFGEGPAYRPTVENAVYVEAPMRGRGVGKALLAELVRLAGEAARLVMVAKIVGALHGRFGFRQVGVLEGVGPKFGRRLDVVLMQREL